jgi:hypothetical protein
MGLMSIYRETASFFGNKENEGSRRPRPFVNLKIRAKRNSQPYKTSMMGALSRWKRAVSIRRLQIVAGKVGRTHEVEIVEIAH